MNIEVLQVIQIELMTHLEALWLYIFLQHISKFLSMEEQVTMFLVFVSYNERKRVMAE